MKNIMDFLKKNKIYVIIVFAVIIVLCSFLILKCFMNKDSNVDLVSDKCECTSDEDNTTEQNSENITNDTSEDDDDDITKSTLIKRLYAKVSNNIRSNNTYQNSKNKNFSISDLDYATKFEMALAIARENDKTVINCLDYSSSELFPKNTSKLYPNGVTTDALELFACGNSNYNATTDKFDSGFNNLTIVPATAYLESSIRKNMILIFGKDYYVRKDEIDSVGTYKYLDDIKAYVLIKDYRGGYNSFVSGGIINVKKKDKNLIIQEIVRDDNEDSSLNPYYVYYTFTYDSNNEDYYLTHIKTVVDNE